MGIEVTLGGDDDGRRLDRILRKYLPDLPLSALHRLLRKGAIRLDGKRAEASARVRAGSILILPDGEEGRNPAERLPVAVSDAASIPASKLVPIFENELLLVVRKEAGTLTHGPGSLDEEVARYLAGKLAPSLSFKPGPLHRLDQGTSGLIVFSKSIEGARRFSAAIAERRVGKSYLAVLDGRMPGTQEWQDRIARDGDRRRSFVAADGAAANLVARTLATGTGSTLALLELGTGRTHQIRVQAASRGFPLTGDRKYGGSPLPGGFLLHAYQMDGPPDENDLMPAVLTSRPPARFLDFVARNFSAAWAERFARGLPSSTLLDAILD